MEPKFKPQDFVNFKHDPEMAIHIVESLVQRCYADVQVHYAGRLYRKEDTWKRIKKDEMPGRERVWVMVGTDIRKYFETELGEIVTKEEESEQTNV